MRCVRGLLAALIGFGLFGAATAQAAVDKDKLVGTWMVVKGEGVPAGMAFEFTKDGKITVKVDFNGMSIVVNGAYKLDGEKLTLSMKTPDGKEEKETDTIKTLTDDKLVLVDDKGKEIEFKRAAKK